VKISLEIYYLPSDFIIWVSVTGKYPLSFMSSTTEVFALCIQLLCQKPLWFLDMPRELHSLEVFDI